MRKKKRKYLNFYYKCMKNGKIPWIDTLTVTGGLCAIFGSDIKIFEPTNDELEYRYTWGYWGLDDLQYVSTINNNQFSPLRQNIVLLLAAMAGEL